MGIFNILTGTSSDSNYSTINDLQKRIKELESNNSLRSPSPPSPPSPTPSNNQYAVLFLDGDNDIFDSMYIKNGYKGGKSAANDLREKTLFYLSKEYGIGLNDLQVLTYVFMNLNGLKGFLGRSQGIHTKIVDEFFKGFNSSPFPFAAIDCGSTAQAADQSLLNWIPHHIQQESCRYVFLGGSHDSGYAPMIHRLPVDQRKKIILLRTSSKIAYQFTVLNLPEASLTGMFDGRRNREIVDQVTENGRNVAQISSSSLVAAGASNNSSLGSTQVGLGIRNIPLISPTAAPFVPSTTVISPIRSTPQVNSTASQSYGVSNSTAGISANLNPTTLPLSSSAPSYGVFTPLITRLEIRSRQGFSTLYTAPLESMFTTIYNDYRYPRIIDLASYVREAEALNLIKVGNNIHGQWVELKVSLNAPLVVQETSVATTNDIPTIASTAHKPATLVYSSSTTPTKFLVDVITSFLPTKQVLRGMVCERYLGEYRKIYLDNSYPEIHSFGDLCKAAERQGSIVCGGERTREWLSLPTTFPSTSTNQLTRDNSAAPIASVSTPAASTSTTSPSAATTTTRANNSPLITAPTVSISRNPYIPLLSALRSFPQARILRGIVASRFLHEFCEIYSDPTFPRIMNFKSYCKEAELAGYVNLGVGSVTGSEWISLSERFAPSSTTSTSNVTHNISTTNNAMIRANDITSVASSSSSVSASTAITTTSTTTSANSTRFSTLIAVLKPHGAQRMKCNEIAAAVLRMNKNAFITAGFEKWSRYAGEAAKLGVITLGANNDILDHGGQTWVSLNAEYLN